MGVWDGTNGTACDDWVAAATNVQEFAAADAQASCASTSSGSQHGAKVARAGDHVRPCLSRVRERSIQLLPQGPVIGAGARQEGSQAGDQPRIRTKAARV